MSAPQTRNLAFSGNKKVTSLQRSMHQNWLSHTVANIGQLNFKPLASYTLIMERASGELFLPNTN